jgi:hypothetical protein
MKPHFRREDTKRRYQQSSTRPGTSPAIILFFRIGRRRNVHAANAVNVR